MFIDHGLGLGVNDDVPYAVPSYPTDEEVCRFRSVNPMEYSQG